jgi:iron complex transport system ATP-binding protein
MQAPILQAEEISVTFGDTKVIDEASFDIAPGSFLGIIGPNGAGKTTLLRILGGLLRPDRGAVTWKDKPLLLLSRQEIARLIGYVPQGVDLAFPFTVREVVKMGRYTHSRGMLAIDEKGAGVVDAALDWMDLKELAGRPFTQLSGGEKQRVLIASALAQEPALMLLDEPTSALDLKHQQSIYRMLQKLSETAGKTIVIVTHDINLAAQFCSRLILLHKGRIIKDGTPDDVLRFPVIQEVYGVKVYIDINPFTESIYILPYDTQ